MKNEESFLSKPIEPNPIIEEYKKHIDWGLIQENLKLTPTQRLEKLMELQRFYEELKRAGESFRNSP